MRLWILTLAVCAATAFASVQLEPGFDPQDIVRQVSSSRDVPGSRPSHVPPRQADRRSGSAGAVGDALPGTEFLIDTSSALVPSPGNQTEPAVAFDGTNYLVVWEDARSSYSDISGARVAPDGTLLDPSGFVICQAPYEQRYPAAAFDGNNFIVVWDDYRRGHAYDIYGTRVSTGGVVLDPVGIIISQATSDQVRPDVTFDGADYLVVWQDYHFNVDAPDICGARVTPAGIVLDSASIVVSDAVGTQATPALAFDGVNYLVVWQDARDSIYGHIYGSLVTPQGDVLNPSGIMISQYDATQSYPAIAFSGIQFLVAWTDVRGSFPPEVNVYGSRVLMDGTVVDPSGLDVGVGGGLQAFPAVIPDSGDFLVVWQDGRGGGGNDVYGARVASDGRVLDSRGFAVSAGAGTQAAPALGFDGTNFLAVWQDDRGNLTQTDIYGARITPDAVVLDSEGFLMSTSARDQFAPGLGYDGANFLVVWEDYRSGFGDIYGARVTPSGTVIDHANFAIAAAENDQRFPAVGFDGTNYLVVWQDYRGNPDECDIYGARVAPGGSVLDPDGIAISQAASRQSYPAVGFDGTNFLVAWQDGRSGGASFDIYGARVSLAGSVLDPDGIAISQASGAQQSPAIGSDGTNSFVVWRDARGGTYSDIYGARVSPAGSVLDGNGIAISTAGRDQASPVIAFDGTNYLVAWTDHRNGIYPDIYGARVTPGGAVLDGAGRSISVSFKDQFGPAVAFDGTSYLVVWEDWRSGNNPDIYGAHVMPGGFVADEGGVVRTPGEQVGLVLARGPGSTLFLAYQGWAGVVNGKTYNTNRIWGLVNPNTGSAIAEDPTAGPRTMEFATLLRGVLFMPEALSHRFQAACLLDAGGRKVMDLNAGANDVSGLAPGVYFVRAAQAQAVAKVVIQH